MKKERVSKKLYHRYIMTSSDDIMDFPTYVRVTRPYRRKVFAQRFTLVAVCISLVATVTAVLL